ncbi:MAG: response regulator [Deltaproteobacteria bacterium]|nr:response regulator [Deltaproteobacteria bacterium]
MEKMSPEGQVPFNLDIVFRRGLGRTLLLCFFGLSMIPLVAMGLIGYQTAYHRLEQETRRHIRIAAELKSNQLQRFVDDGLAGADRHGHEPPAVTVFNTAGQVLEALVKKGTGYRVYLVGADLTLLAGTSGNPPLDSGTRVDTAQTRLWRKNQTGDNSQPAPPEPFTYIGPYGRQVIGTYAEVHIGGTPCALIVEIDTAKAFDALNALRAIIVALVILTGLGVLAVSTTLARSIVEPVRDLSRNLLMVSEDRLDQGVHVTANHEIGELAAAFGSMIEHLKATNAEKDAQSRFMSGLTRLHRLIGGQQEPGELCLSTLEFLSGFLDLRQAGFFIMDADGRLKCAGRFPGHPDSECQQVFSPGDGQVGQAAIEKTTAFFQKEASSGSMTPSPTPDRASLIVVPLMLRQTVKGVLELEKTDGFNRFDCRFLESAAAVIAVAVNSASTRQQEEALLERTRQQAQQLKVREASLEASTRELKSKHLAFLASEEKLQLKQLELEAANAQMVKNAADLEAHMAILEKQKLDMEKQNNELEKTHRELAKKARQLEISSQYKTEFMANMSHELRTPLNSILLLSRLLLENREKTLTDRQSEFARTIHSAGEDLLNLINEILDLAKVESGKMEVDLQAVRVQAIADAMQVSFAPLAEQSGVTFTSHVAPDVPERLITDRKRIEQIVKNFLSNAFKFTARGSIRLEITVSRELIICRGAGDSHDNGCLAISVMDTGIGIPAAKHQMVFDAFQQVDGSTRRKYGGTGLGLSISRELAHLLGGEITIESEEGKGSRFTLHLPIIPLPDKEPAAIQASLFKAASIETAEPPPPEKDGGALLGMEPVPDDRHRLTPGDPCILIIDANAVSTEPIKEYAYRMGYKVLVAEQFRTGLHFADYYLPTAIFANLNLPGVEGWEIIQPIKANPRSRHIPVFTLSPRPDDFAAAIHGAAGHVIEPITARHLESAFRLIDHLQSIDDRTVLVVAPDPDAIVQVTDAVGGKTIRIMTAATAAEAKTVLEANTVNAVIMHPATPFTEQRRLLTGLQHDPMPVYLYPGGTLKALSRSEISPYAQAVNINVADTPDQLLLGMVLSLHLPANTLDKAHRDRLMAMDAPRSGLKGRKVLLVDDDMRTVFAISNVLEDQGAEVLAGKSGKESLDKLDGFPDIDLVLMDVMISEVDGYQAIREIRNRNRYRTVPIIALTAKAMQGDRARCIEAGADDYLAKPVNLDKLTSVLKIWMDPQLAAPGRFGA